MALLNFQHVEVDHGSDKKEIKTYHYSYEPVEEFEGDVPLVHLVFKNGLYERTDFTFPASMDKEDQGLILAIDNETQRILHGIVPEQVQR